MNENGGPNPDFLNIKGAKEMKNNKKILLWCWFYCVIWSE